MNLLERLQYDWRRGRIIHQLIITNVIIFLIINILFGAFGLFMNTRLVAPLFDWLALSPQLEKFISRPWTIVTYGFLHADVMHILFNMLWLYWIGAILTEYIGNRKVLPIYIYGVLAGGCLFMLFENIFPYFTANLAELPPVVGASAGVMAIIWATVALLPDYKLKLLFLGSIPLIYIATFMSALDLIAISGANAGGAIAHIGGAIMGYWFIKLYQRGIDLSTGFNKLIDRIVTFFSSHKARPLKTTHTRKRTNSRPIRSKVKKSKSPIDQEAELNAILDKISANGYESLTKKEKEFLFKKSK